MISWLRNGVFALAVAGLYSIILVLLRTPGLNNFFSNPDIFKTALVIHVNLSVFVWLLAITCVIWSISKVQFGTEEIFAKLGCGAIVLMALSPLLSGGKPIMNNYIPMLENISFTIGLCLFAVVILMFCVQSIIGTLMQPRSLSYGARIIAATKCTSALLFIGVWICFTLSYYGIDRLSEIVPLEIDYYYEMLFWSGGHLLQFIYTQIMMISLIALVEVWKGGKINYPNIYEMLLWLNSVLASFIFIGHINYDVSDGQFKEFFTKHMIYTAGIAPTICIMVLLIELFQARKRHAPSFIAASFLAAILLFLSGGLIGSAISGINVTIPAHYHGSIVGISIAFMGFTYLICFKAEIEQYLNSSNVANSSSVISSMYETLSYGKGKWSGGHSSRVAARQIYVILLGQLLHIAGLALAGGYGVLRKTPGQELPFSAKFYMGMMGGGGLIAIIGGLMFVYICAKNLYQTHLK